MNFPSGPIKVSPRATMGPVLKNFKVCLKQVIMSKIFFLILTLVVIYETMLVVAKYYERSTLMALLSDHAQATILHRYRELSKLHADCDSDKQDIFDAGYNEKIQLAAWVENWLAELCCEALLCKTDRDLIAKLIQRARDTV